MIDFDFVNFNDYDTLYFVAKGPECVEENGCEEPSCYGYGPFETPHIDFEAFDLEDAEDAGRTTFIEARLATEGEDKDETVSKFVLEAYQTEHGIISVRSVCDSGDCPEKAKSDFVRAIPRFEENGDMVLDIEDSADCTMSLVFTKKQS